MLNDMAEKSTALAKADIETHNRVSVECLLSNPPKDTQVIFSLYRYPGIAGRI